MKGFVRKIAVLVAVSLFIGAMAYAAPVTLDCFAYKQEIKDQLTELGNAFSKVYPNITVTWEIIPNNSMQVLTTRMSSGQAPTIIELQSYAAVSQFAKAGWLMDLTSQPVMKKVSPGAFNAVTYNGKYYALPGDIAGIGIIYNKDIFKKYNLQAPQTFSQLQAVAATLKKNGITPFSICLKDNWPSGHFITLIHTSLIGDQGKVLKWISAMNAGTASFADPIDKNKLFQVLDFYKDNGDPNAANNDYPASESAFAKGTAAMIVQGLWAYGDMIGMNPNLNVGFIPFPVTENAKDARLYADVDSTWAVSASASPDKKDAALKFINWLSSPEAVQIWSKDCKLVPVFKGASVKGMLPPFQDLYSYIDKGQTLPWAFSMYPVPAFEDACKNGGQAYLIGKENADQVVSYIDSTWKANIGK